MCSELLFESPMDGSYKCSNNDERFGCDFKISMVRFNEIVRARYKTRKPISNNSEEESNLSDLNNL